MQLIPVTDAALAKEFIKVNVELNRSSAAYIRPLDQDINGVFDPARNKAFRHGECIRWILKDEEGTPAGRIAAFVNKRYKTKGDDGPVGGIGFFDCINNQDAADMLFDTAKHWLLQRGMEAMDGPINFGERDNWWGLVTMGFGEPLYAMNFNPPYYRELFENYGFKSFFLQYCFGLDPRKPLAPKIFDRYAVLAADPGYQIRHIEKKNLEKYADDFVTVYNKAWAGHGGLKEMKTDQALVLFKKMKPFMDEEILLFAYYKEEPIAIFLNIPDLNQYFKHFNGRLGLVQKLWFLWMKYRKTCKKFTGVVFGVIPEFQAKGVDAFIIEGLRQAVERGDHYLEYQMQWIGDFNPKMVNIAKGLSNSQVSCTLTTYRYLFDRTKEFKRHPMLA